MSSTRDQWLLPRHQTEYPGRDFLPEGTVHRRRETTFLVLVTMFVAAGCSLVLLGTTRVLDVRLLLANVGIHVDPPVAMHLPLGVVPVAISFAASALVVRLFGGRRAATMIWIGLFASAALVGLMHTADRIDGGHAFGIAVAFTVYFVVAHALQLLILAATRGRSMIPSMFLASLFAQPLGWCAAGLVMHLERTSFGAAITQQEILALMAGSAACVFACVVALALPVAMVARWLALALRVGQESELVDSRETQEPDDNDEYGRVTVLDPPARSFEPAFERVLAEGSSARKLPKAEIVEAEVRPPRANTQPGIVVPSRATVLPYSSAEIRFFSDGDDALDS